MREQRGPSIETKLSPNDHYRFSMLARSRKTTITQLSRDAIIYYLDNYEQSLSNEAEGSFAKQLRESTATIIEALFKCTNRICGLLAKTAISSETTNQYIAATGNNKELLNQSRGIAVKKISGFLSLDECDRFK